MQTKIHGVILAGGKASRMNGTDKGLVNYQSKPMIAHVLSRLEPQVQSITICANRNIDIYKQHHQNVIIDDGDPFRGPLVGLLTAMRHLSQTCHSDDWVMLAPCDAPLLATDLRQKLVGTTLAPLSGITALLPYDGHHHQVLFSMLPLRATENLQSFINQQKFKAIDWLLSLQPRIVDLSEIALSFTNVNSLQQLNALNNGR